MNNKKGKAGEWVLIRADQNLTTLKWYAVLANLSDVKIGVMYPRCIMSQGHDTLEQAVNSCMNVCGGLPENEYK